ncbi:MAG: DUF2922 domain-containing protein [Eubacterium sp.]|nr:DUF2922 domain-containing protein [Eubacterium sp.]
MKTIQNELVLSFKRGDGKAQGMRIADFNANLDNAVILESTAGILASGVFTYGGASLVSLNSAIKVRTEKEPIVF